MKKILVLDIMTREPIGVQPDADLLLCARKMIKEKIHSLVIVDKKELKGFVSQRDILWAIVKKSRADLSKIKAIDISPRKIVHISPSSTLHKAVIKMKKSKFYKLPVVKEKKLVGLITIKDILNFHPEVYSEFDEFSKIREETEKLKRMKRAKEESEGMCDECGNFDILFDVGGELICETCRNQGNN